MFQEPRANCKEGEGSLLAGIMDECVKSSGVNIEALGFKQRRTGSATEESEKPGIFASLCRLVKPMYGNYTSQPIIYNYA